MPDLDLDELEAFCRETRIDDDDWRLALIARVRELEAPHVAATRAHLPHTESAPGGADDTTEADEVWTEAEGEWRRRAGAEVMCTGSWSIVDRFGLEGDDEHECYFRCSDCEVDHPRYCPYNEWEPGEYTPEEEAQMIKEWERSRGGAWQPVETAPEDGTFVRAIWENGGTVERLHYFHGGRWRDERGGSYAEPTHWQPLPPPPGGADSRGIRICPERDAPCPHGADCPYSIDRFTCGSEDKA